MTAFTEADVPRQGPAANPSNTVPAINAAAQGASGIIPRRGNLLTARVQGSEYAPYEIAVSLLDDGSIDYVLHLSLRLGRLLQAHRRGPVDGAAGGRDHRQAGTGQRWPA